VKVCIFGDAHSVHIQRLGPALVNRGLEVHVVWHTPADVPGVTVERFRVPRPGLGNLRRWRGRSIRYLRDFLRRFDVVNIHFLHDWGFTPQIMEDGCVVATPWGSDIIPPPGERPPTEAMKALRVSMLRSAAGVTAWGPTFAAMVAEFAGIEAETIALLPLGVDPEQFRPIESGPTNGRDGFHVGFFKGFREVYGSTYLLEAAPIVLRELPATRFHLMGDGPQLSECQRLARGYGIEWAVEWIPRRAHRTICNYLARWDITVIPSICESFGAAALESSAMCVPVVASNVGGLPETVRHGETGLLVPPRDSGAIAEAIIKLLNNPGLRERMGENGRRMVIEEYDWHKTLGDWVRTYETALDRASVMV
jgi:glycosyltransferase involved in cell wall biosynthesis